MGWVFFLYHILDGLTCSPEAIFTQHVQRSGVLNSPFCFDTQLETFFEAADLISEVILYFLKLFFDEGTFTK